MAPGIALLQSFHTASAKNGTYGAFIDLALLPLKYLNSTRWQSVAAGMA